MNRLKLGKNARLALLLLTLAALLGGTYYLSRLILGRTSDAHAFTQRVDSILMATLSAAEVAPADIRKNYVAKHNDALEWEQVEVLVTLEESQSLYALSDRLCDSLSIPDIVVKKHASDSDPSFNELAVSVYLRELPIYQILLRRPKPAASAPAPADEGRSKIALVIDDVGYDIDRALELLNLRRPMTISIFPQLRYSRHIAEVAHAMGYEVMMHLPMESGRRLRRNPGFIEQNMSEEQLRWVLDRDFESIPYIAGVNNHQGSKMTADPAAMARVMRYLAERDVFFIDSRTTGDSVAYQVATTHGLRAAENDIFLDNEKDVDYIKERIGMLIQEAEEKGEAIGICHVHPATMRALVEMFPVIEERGIELVYASELVR